MEAEKDRMNQYTLHGHSLWDISSMLQKAIRRCDFERAGYAAYEMYGKYKAYLWRRLIQISAEDVWGIMTNEIVGLYYADCICSNGKKGYDADPIFVAKAITLLCMARKNRDACYVACNFMVPDHCMDESDFEHLDIVDIKNCKLADNKIPDWVFDVHTWYGKKNGKTDWQMNLDEQAALKPLQMGMFDDASWEPRYEYKYRNGIVKEEEYQEHLKFREGRVANPVESLPDETGEVLPVPKFKIVPKPEAKYHP